MQESFRGLCSKRNVTPCNDRATGMSVADKQTHTQISYLLPSRGRCPSVMRYGSSQCTIVLPEEYLGYGLVVPFPAYGCSPFGFA
eukprot:scaffold101374_cov36-Phaeocystis_antarctica.AAC.2